MHKRRPSSHEPDAARAGTRLQQPRPVLALSHAVAIIVGIVVGAGIFKTPALVASLSPSAAWMFAAWALGGLVSLIGALVYAELATACPHAGGDYHFLHRAYGRSVAFLFAWARFAVITTGSIALLAFVFGDYMQVLLPLGAQGPAWYAAAAVGLLTGVNLCGIRSSARAQGWLTLVEVGGLLTIVLAGLWLSPAGGGAPAPVPAAAAAAVPQASAAGFGMAMVLVLLTYGGWNEAAYLSAELKDRRRNMRRALLVSIGLLTALYLSVTWAYWQGLGLQRMAASPAIGAELLDAALGPPGARLMAVLVAVAALTSINATMIVGARTSFALGRDWPPLARLGEWNGERGTPAVALVVQGAASLALVALGSLAGSGFTAMVEYTAPVFWLFFLLCGLSLIVLRWREPHLERPVKVPWYPLLPLLFCAACAFMLWSSLSYVHGQTLNGFNAAWIGVVVLALGGLLLAVLRIASPSSTQTHRSLP